MKGKRRIVAFLLTLALVFSYMPAMAFADSSSAPKSIKFTSAQPIQGYIASWGADIEKEGNSVTLTFSGGRTETYKYIDFYDEESDDNYYGWYLDGDHKKNKIDHIWVETDGRLQAGSNSGFVRYYYDWENDEEKYVETPVTIKGVANSDIKSVSFKQNTPITVDYENRWEWEDNEEVFLGNEITVVHKDYTRTYVHQKEPYKDGDNDYGYACTVKGEDEDWQDVLPTELVADQNVGSWEPGKTYTASVYVEGVAASEKVNIKVKDIPKPEKVEVVQTSPASALIGQDYIDTSQLYGKGNKIVITYDDTNKTVREYNYETGDGDEGFYYTDENGEKRQFWGWINLKGRVPKGKNKTVSGTISVDWEGTETSLSLPVSVKTTASKYYAYTVFKTYTYTGKKITPKVVVKYWTGKKLKTMPAKWYTCKPKKNTKIGDYFYKVTIKKSYRKKYGTTLYGYYDIIPKAPTIKSATAGTNSLTVTWKKYSASAQKNINGFIIVCSTSSKFKDGVTDHYWVENKKASKYTIKGLEKGKKYYVRVISFKDKNEMSFWSNPSKTKSVTVK